ncbi:MAG: hypothetical protein AAF318_04700 [Pseudomonadota bacterium]
MNAPLKHRQRLTGAGGLTILCASDDASVKAPLQEAVDKVLGARLQTVKLSGLKLDAAADAKVVFADVGAADAMTAELVARIEAVAAAAPLILVVNRVDGVSAARLALRVNAIDILEKPLDAPGLHGAITDAMTREGRAPADVTAVTSAVGGAGGTTIAVALAEHLAARKKGAKRTCLIDLDHATGGAGMHLDAVSAHDIGLDERDLEAIDASFLGAVTRAAGPFSVLSLPTHGARRDTMWQFCLRALDVLEREYDGLVVDVPHFVPDEHLSVLAAVNRVFIVTRATVPALKIAHGKAQALTKLGCAADAVTVVVNRHKRGLFQSGLDTKAIEEILAPARVAYVAADDETCTEAVNCGVPLGTVRRKNAVSRDVAALLQASDTPAGR